MATSTLPFAHATHATLPRPLHSIRDNRILGKLKLFCCNWVAFFINSQCTLIPCAVHLAVCFTATSTDSSGRSLLVAPYVMWGSSSPLSARKDAMRRASKSSTMFIAAAVRRNTLRVSGRCRQGP